MDEDPREAILKYTDAAKKDPKFIALVYSETQPKPVFAESSCSPGTNDGGISGPSIEPTGVESMKSLQRKRYLNMTLDQKETYLQRNREYKRMKQDDTGACSNIHVTTGLPNSTRSIQMESSSSKRNKGNYQYKRKKQYDGVNIINIHTTTGKSDTSTTKNVCTLLDRSKLEEATKMCSYVPAKRVMTIPNFLSTEAPLLRENSSPSDSYLHKTVIHQSKALSKKEQDAKVGSFDTLMSKQDTIPRQPNMLRPTNGVRLLISTSVIHVSSVSSKDQVNNNGLTNINQHKLLRNTNWYSKLEPEKKEAYLRRKRKSRKRKKSDGESCICEQEHTNTDHEDVIYLPTYSILDIYDNNELSRDMIE